MPAMRSAAMACAAVTPEPQYTPTAAPGTTPSAAYRARSASAAAKPPSAVRLSAVGRAARAGNVPRPRVDRLDLAAVALPRPGVEQHAVAGQRGRLVGGQHRQVAAVQATSPGSGR